MRRAALPAGARLLDAGPLPYSILPQSARDSEDAILGLCLFLGLPIRQMRELLPSSATFRLIELPVSALDSNVTHDLADYDDCGVADCDEDHRAKVTAMMAALRRGEEMPPIVVASLPDKPDVAPYLIDGFHRLTAHHHAGRRSIRAYQLILPARG